MKSPVLPEFTAVHMGSQDLGYIFNELTQLAGEAITQQAVQCAIRYRSEYADGTRLRHGSFVLQPAGEAEDRPGITLVVDGDGNGAYAETTLAVEDWAGYRSVGSLMLLQPAKSIAATTILDRANAVLSATPRIASQPLSEAKPSRFMNADMDARQFVPLIGRLLMMTDYGLKFSAMDVAVDTARGILAGPHRHSANLQALGEGDDGVATEFKLEYVRTRANHPYEDQFVAFDCSVIIEPGKTQPTILYAIDQLETRSELRRVRRTTPRGNSRLSDELSSQPTAPNDVLDLAGAALNPSNYIERRWPEFTANRHAG